MSPRDHTEKASLSWLHLTFTALGGVVLLFIAPPTVGIRNLFRGTLGPPAANTQLCELAGSAGFACGS